MNHQATRTNRLPLAVCAVAIAACAAGATARADYDPVRWQHLRPLLPTTPGWVRVELDRQVHAHAARQLADVRLLDDTGAEIPFALRQFEPDSRVVELPATLLNNGVVRGERVVDIDTGGDDEIPPERRVHNRIDLDISGPNFVRRAEVAASSDRVNWRVLLSDGLVFSHQRLAIDARESQLSYSDTDLRYLRVRLYGGEGPVPDIHAATLQRTVSRPGVERSATVAVLGHVLEAGRSLVDFDLGSAAAPADRVRLEVKTPEFARWTELQFSADRKRWDASQGSGELTQFRVAGRTVSKTELEVHGAQGRYLRATVRNGDDAALEIASATITWYPRFVVFEAAAGRTYRLAYGNPKASEPRYDLTRRIESTEPEVKEGPALDAEQPNPAYEPEKPPWTERLPWLPNAAVAVGAAALGLVLFRAIRGMKKA